jgi:hypothetical protein
MNFAEYFQGIQRLVVVRFRNLARRHPKKCPKNSNMRITQIREKTALIASPISNAYIDFSKMTCSVVAVVTDVVRNGIPVVGYGFNSNGRYDQGASSGSDSARGFSRPSQKC